MSALLNSQQVLKELGLGRNHRYVGYLVQRGLLPRIVLGPRTFRYDPEDIEALKEQAKKHGVLLTVKPD